MLQICFLTRPHVKQHRGSYSITYTGCQDERWLTSRDWIFQDTWPRMVCTTLCLVWVFGIRDRRNLNSSFRVDLLFFCLFCSNLSVLELFSKRARDSVTWKKRMNNLWMNKKHLVKNLSILLNLKCEEKHFSQAMKTTKSNSIRIFRVFTLSLCLQGLEKMEWLQ